MREKILTYIEKNSRVSLKDLAILLGTDEITVANEIAELRDDRKMSLDMFYRDPYMLDFLGLKDTYSEKDLENAILAELEKFILEMGSDFAFLARHGNQFYKTKKRLPCVKGAVERQRN